MKNTAKVIREELKKVGYNNKLISVKTKLGMEETIKITIKDTSISIKEIEEIANKHKSVRYDDNMQEQILAGGNTFIDISYDYKIMNKSSKNYFDRCKNIIEDNKYNKFLAEIYKDENVKVLYSNKINSGIEHLKVEIQKETYNYCANTYKKMAEAIIMINANHKIKI